MQKSCDTLITAALLLTQNSERQIIEDAAIAVCGGTICAAGTRAGLAEYVPQKTLHLGNALLMPGLVNAHTHVPMTFLRGLADDLPLMEWLTQHIFPAETHLTAEIVELGATIGCAEMIRTGTTTLADMYLIQQSATAAIEKSGLRALAGEVIFAFPSPAYATVEECFALVRAEAARLSNHSRIRVAVMPHSVYTTTPEILQSSRDLARELSLPLYIHLAETPSETEACAAAHGKRPVEYCHSLGLLGPTTTIAHGVELNAEELDLLKSTGTHIVHNPKSNMKLASGIAPVSAMLARGMLPGLGTDGAASNNSLSMFAEMNACALLHKVHTGDPTALPAQTVLDMATIGSAAAIGWPELGQIVPGSPADLIALDLDAPNLQPMYNPVSHLVYAASGHEVRLTMVDGKILYQDGVYKTIDYPHLLQEAQKLKQWVLKKSGAR